ncbi:MAG: YkgJ family cysteine cluster protein [Methanomicrobiales archaeon]|nr:YkgJ family cysteine cluster protein [Methanomicrobiales archaeon]
MAFECFQCGECCKKLGLVHSITAEYGEFQFVVHNCHTGEDTPVTVDTDKRALFLDRSIFSGLPDACPFFRHMPGSDLAWCTVHHTRPDLCRDYSCWRLLILNHRGRRVGKIKYIRTLVSDDATLNRIWAQCIEPIQDSDDKTWEDAMIRILSRAGYAVRR